jgi:hypothetical protein
MKRDEGWDFSPNRKDRHPPKKRSQAADFKLGGRTRGIARSALGRVYVGDGGVYLVRGEPDAAKLAEYLVGLKYLPEPDDPPSPLSLGFAASDISRVTEKELAEYANALQRWRHQLEKHASSRHRTAAVRRQQAQWQDEIVGISGHLGFLRVLLSNPKETTQGLWRCVPLPQAEQRRLDAAFKSCSAKNHLPPLWKLYATIAAWLHGVDAAERILKALSPHLLSLEDYHLRNCLVALKCYAHEALPARYRLDEDTEDNKGEYVSMEPCIITRDLQNCLDGLPDSMFGPGPGLIPLPPRRRRDLPDYLRHLLPSRCDAILEKLDILPDHVAASITAIYISVDTEVELLAEVFRNCEKPFADNCLQLLGKLRPHFGGKGLAPLVRYLHTMPKDLLPGNLEPIGQFLAAGESLEDMLFVTRVGDGERWRLSEVLSGLRQKGIPLRPLADFGRALKSNGAGLQSKDFLDIAEETSRIGHTRVLDAFNALIGLLEGEAFTPRLAEAVRASAVGAARLTGWDPRLRAKLEQWVTPPRSLPAMPGRPEDLGEEVTVWLDRMAYYHRLAGRKPEIPAGFMKSLTAGDVRGKELAFLQKQRAAGTLTEAMSRRLQLLESRGPEVPAAPGTKLVRKAKQSCALAALEAIKHLVTEEARRSWSEAIGTPSVEIPFEHMSDVAKWFTQLPAKEMAAAKALLAAHRQDPRRYREMLPSNAEWLAEAARRGLDIEAWLHPPAVESECGGVRVRMGISENPCLSFLMGSYFGTCLNLEDGCNREAVVANASDANKAVLYVSDTEGHVLGRKLLCVNEQFGLLGYRTYLSGDDRQLRKKLRQAVDAFCGSWARRAGLKLVNTGKPGNLCKLFWYDDGAESWSGDAHRAWLQGGEFSLSMTATKLHPNLEGAVRARERACLDYLNALGLAPAGGGGSLAALLDDPELAEETLVNLAALNADEGLAQLLVDCAWSESAGIDALLLLGRIRGDRFVDEMLSRVPGAEVDEKGYHKVPWQHADRAARTLLEIGTKLSYRRLFDLVLDCVASPIWLQLAAGKPQQALEAMHEAAADRTFDWGIEPPAHIVLFVEAVRSAASPESLSRLVRKIVTHQSMGSWGIFPWRSRMIGWLGRLLSDRAVTPDLFELVCADYLDEWEQEHCEPTADPEEFVTGSILALCKSGSAATRYLHDTSSKSPAALLALALSCPKRYADFITERALATPMSRAAALALWVVKGPKEGRRLLEQGWSRCPGHLRMIDRVDQLFQAYTALAFEDHEKVIGHPDRNAARECLPLLLHSIWRHMGEIERGAAPLRLPRIETRQGGVRDLKLPLDEVSGLAALLVRLMREADGERLEDLRGALRDILHLHWGASWDMLIALDILSGGRVISDEKLGADEWCPRDIDLSSQMGDLLLLAPDGSETEFARRLGRKVKPRWRRPWSIPPDPARARRLMAILRKRQAKVLEDKDVAPHSEIGRRLFKLYAEWAVPVDEGL